MEIRAYLDSLEQGPPPTGVDWETFRNIAKSDDVRYGKVLSRLNSLEATITNIDIEWKALGKDFEAQWERVERIEKVLRETLVYLYTWKLGFRTDDINNLIAMLAHPSNKEETDG